MMETLEDRMLFSYPGFWQATAPSTSITKIVGPTLNGQGNDVSMEPIELNGERLTLSPSPDP